MTHTRLGTGGGKSEGVDMTHTRLGTGGGKK